MYKDTTNVDIGATLCTAEELYKWVLHRKRRRWIDVMTSWWCHNVMMMSECQDYVTGSWYHILYKKKLTRNIKDQLFHKKTCVLLSETQLFGPAIGSYVSRPVCPGLSVTKASFGISQHYLQLFYWHYGRENSSSPIFFSAKTVISWKFAYFSKNTVVTVRTFQYCSSDDDYL